MIKWLVHRNVQGAQGGYLTLFFDGVYGIIMLIFLTAFGDGLYQVELANFFTTFFGGVLTCLAIVLVNYGVANGIAGVAFSYANSFPAWHSIFNWVVLGQLMSTG